MSLSCIHYLENEKTSFWFLFGVFQKVPTVTPLFLYESRPPGGGGGINYATTNPNIEAEGT